MTKQSFQYEPIEAFGESLTTAKPWNKDALVQVERLNGRVAMVAITVFALEEAVFKAPIVEKTSVFFKPVWELF